MEIAMMAILTLALLAAVVSFTVMGLRQARHTKRLAQKAGARDLHFSHDDPFEIPERYRNFALLSGGHTPRATNVTYGQLDSHTIRAFEFRYEVGHGTRRTTCRYSVIVVELPSPPGDVLMWNHSDVEQAPLEARQVDGDVGCWSYRGSNSLAERLGQAAGRLTTENLSLQTHNNIFLLCLPFQQPLGRDYFTWLDDATRLVQAVLE